MAIDCYQVYKNTFSQAIADGLASAVATAAAQAAMGACLASQNEQSPTAIPQIVVTGTRIHDVGPLRPKTR